MKAVITIALAAMSFGAIAQTQQPVKISEFMKDKKEPTIEEVFADLAHFRDSLGLSEVVLDPALCRAAQLQADWIAATGKFQHNQDQVAPGTGVNVVLPNPWDRGDRVGATVKSENLHTGWKFLPASFIVKSWGISKGHRANMVRTPPAGKPLAVGLAIAHYKNNPNEIVVVLTIGESTE